MNTKEKKIVLELQTKTSDAIKKIDEYKQNTKQLIETNKELKEQLRAGDIDHKKYREEITKNKKYREEITKNKKTIEENNKAISTLGKEIDGNNRKIRMLESSAKELRKELDTVTTSFNALSESEQNGAKGTELLDKMTRLTERLNEVENKAADVEAAFGGYENVIFKALGMTGSFTKSLITLAQSGGGFVGFFKNIATAISGFSKQLLALMANPIIAVIAAIVVAFMLLSKAFTRNEDNVAKLNVMMAKLSGLFAGLLNALEPVASFLVDVLVEGFETLMSWVDKLLDSLPSFLSMLGFDKAAESVQKFSNSIKETSKMAAELVKSEADLVKSKRKFVKN